MKIQRKTNSIYKHKKQEGKDKDKKKTGNIKEILIGS